MNPRTILACVALISLTGTPLLAQEGGVKSTTTLHQDGTRTDMIRNFSEGTGVSKTFDAAGKVIQSMKFKLGQLGQPAEGTAFNAKGVPIFKYTYKRDGNGRLEEEVNYLPNGRMIRRLVYHYKANGEISGIDAYDANGNLLQPAEVGSKKNKRSR